MTPFGMAVRRMRAERGVSQRDMARALGVSSAYLSALEHGRRGRPSWEFVQKSIGYFNIIWDEAEALQALAELSDPRVTVDTIGLSSEATALANRFAALVRDLDSETIARLDAILAESQKAS